MSEREKLKPEEKVKIVIKYIAGEVSISVPRSSTTIVAARGRQKNRSILLKIFWTGSFMPQSPMRSGLPM